MNNVTLRETAPTSEFSTKFLQGMVDRVGMSFYKYGNASDNFPTPIDAIASLKQRLEEYAKTGNTEFLIDAANFAMLEFMHPAHPKAHYRATDSDESPGRVSR